MPRDSRVRPDQPNHWVLSRKPERIGKQQVHLAAVVVVSCLQVEKTSAAGLWFGFHLGFLFFLGGGVGF